MRVAHLSSDSRVQGLIRKPDHPDGRLLEDGFELCSNRRSNATSSMRLSNPRSPRREMIDPLICWSPTLLLVGSGRVGSPGVIVRARVNSNSRVQGLLRIAIRRAIVVGAAHDAESPAREHKPGIHPTSREKAKTTVRGLLREGPAAPQQPNPLHTRRVSPRLTPAGPISPLPYVRVRLGANLIVF